MSRSDRDRLLDVLEAGAAIAEHLQRGPLSDGLVLDAVMVRLIEIGEAVKDISAELLSQEPSIPWRQVVAIRNQRAHRYCDTSHAIVAHTVGPDLVQLLAANRSLRAALDALADPVYGGCSWADSRRPQAVSGCRRSAEQDMRSVTEPSAGARPAPSPNAGATGGSRQFARARARKAMAERAIQVPTAMSQGCLFPHLPRVRATTAPLEGDVDVDKVEVTGPGTAPADAGRHRLHRSPARGHAMKVLYGDDEWVLIVQAAQMLGLRPSSYVASAALSAAQLAVHPPQAYGTGRRHRAAAPAADRELLVELMQARTAVNRYGVNVNQAVAVLHGVGQAPVWLDQAVAGAHRAVERVDEAAALVARRLSRGRG